MVTAFIGKPFHLPQLNWGFEYFAVRVEEMGRYFEVPRSSSLYPQGES